MFRTTIIIFTLFASMVKSYALEASTIIFHSQNRTFTNDTIRCIRLPEVIITPNKKQALEYSQIPRKYRKGTRAYNRTIRNLKVVYPYAKLAARKVAEVEDSIKHIPDEKTRKAYIKREYKALLKRYKKPLINLKISQGKMLVKLIERETKNTSFEHLKHYKGGFTAFFWQSFARLFSINLKDRYDKNGKDRYLEQLIIEYENGEL